MRTLLRLTCFFSVCTIALPQDAEKGTFKLLYAFSSNGGPSSLVEIYPGLFVGTTAYNSGTIFSITSSGQFKTVHQFPSQYPADSVVQTSTGELLGFGGPPNQNSYFSLKPDGASFQSYPTGSLGEPAAFGAPAPGGYVVDLMAQSLSTATINHVYPNGKVTVVHTFTPSEIGYLANEQPLQLARDGSIYGVGTETPVSPDYWLFRYTRQGDFTKLATFPSSSIGAGGALVLAPDGTIYGALEQGGLYKRGAIYKLAPDGTYTTLVTFPKWGIAAPFALVLASDGNLYGATREIPTYLFRVNLQTNQLQTLYIMNLAQGDCNGCVMLQGSDGKLYGAAIDSGNGWGTIFSFDAGLPPPPPTVTILSPSSGAPGQKVQLWGTYLLGATSVSFNGTPAGGVLVTSAQSAYVIVPAGATSGPVTITTPNGSFTTTESFTVN